MVWRSILIVLLTLISSQAHAVKGGGGTGGTGFACEGTTCICNGTYTDCKDMETSCKDKITCTGSYCSCTKKAAQAPSTKAPSVRPKGSIQRY
jgi:hypothetical protein